VTSHQPDRRELFEAQAAPLYDEIVADGGIKADDPRLADGSPQRLGFDLLVELGLVQLDRSEETWLPEDPTSVQSRVVAPLSQEGAQLLEESSRWAKSFGPLTHAWRRASFTQSRGPFTYLHGEAIDAHLGTLVAEAENEMLTAQPQTGRSAAALAIAARRDIEMLERGATMRTLYQHSARRSSVTHKYVAAVTTRGAEVRTLDEFFNRMIVIDRQVAVIPSGEQLSVAVVIREPAIVAYLVDVFERAWERGRPFTNRERAMMVEIAAEQRAMTIRMLIEGHSDPVSAKRLGVSPRTYAGYVADLKAEYDAETRFQLGYTMGRRGISGTENSSD
jgi:hypothetical protein